MRPGRVGGMAGHGRAARLDQLVLRLEEPIEGRCEAHEGGDEERRAHEAERLGREAALRVCAERPGFVERDFRRARANTTPGRNACPAFGRWMGKLPGGSRSRVRVRSRSVRRHRASGSVTFVDANLNQDSGTCPGHRLTCLGPQEVANTPGLGWHLQRPCHLCSRESTTCLSVYLSVASRSS